MDVIIFNRTKHGGDVCDSAHFVCEFAQVTRIRYTIYSIKVKKRSKHNGLLRDSELAKAKPPARKAINKFLVFMLFI